MVKANTQKSSVKKNTLSKVNSTKELKRLQKAFAAIIMHPLKEQDLMKRDPRSDQMIIPNDRLTAHERLELYARQYWWRIRESIYEDFPGLQAVLGDKVFYELMEKYLVKNPSRSFTLRNLGVELVKFIRKNPKLTKPYTSLASDVAALEWARIEAFDRAELRPISDSSFAVKNPGKVKIILQPYISLLKLKYPVNRFLAALKQREMSGEASNTVLKSRKKKTTKVIKPRQKDTYIAVHRFEGKVYYKELELDEFRILQNFKKSSAIESGLSRTRGIQKIKPAKIQEYFKSWTGLKWICEGK